MIYKLSELAYIILILHSYKLQQSSKYKHQTNKQTNAFKILI